MANEILSSIADLAKLRRIDLSPHWADAAQGIDRDDEEALNTYCEAIGWAPASAYAENPRAHEFPLLAWRPQHGWGVAEQVEADDRLRVVKNGINTVWKGAGDCRLYDLIIPLPAGQQEFTSAFDVFKTSIMRRKHMFVMATMATIVVNIIALAAGQGTLELRVDGAAQTGDEVQCVVRKHGEMATLNAQRMNSSKRYRTGLYDLEILTLPRTIIPDVAIKQSATTPVRIPRSGTLNINAAASGHGAIFAKDGGELRWVTDLISTDAHNQFRLQPGEYKVIYRSATAHQTAFSIEKDVTITSGQAINLDL